MWIKICGITSLEDAAAVAALQPDAIGLNFFSGSKRCVPPDLAAQIVAGLPAGVTPVGVFVNHPVDEIRSICRQCRLSVVQLHGDEPPETAMGLEEFEVIRAFRIGRSGLAAADVELRRYRELGIALRGCIVDAQVEGAYGGTGQRPPWGLLAGGWKPGWPPLILAGGLTPLNVASAITAVRPWGVDVASGVERSPGKKDESAVREFILQARQAAGGRS